ncbi:alpha/beta hydrolase family protein [Paenibacillus harenae]|uniref:Dienelactone hydrolase n=1 Tax=Paenibacillus harenae TaxID=306543 RepID=A0ABT9TZ02_PAEHA|nr:alpha/beta hydrolase [Paenibacillus harenae]MDQ0111685.1 dienelactone hydrolase [Paenibacillus harenae]
MEIAVKEQEKGKLLKFAAWLRMRYDLRADRDSFVWRIATGSLVGFGSLSMYAAVMGMPTGLGPILDNIIFLAANVLAIGVSAFIVSILLSLAYVPVPRRFASVLLYVGIEAYLILYFAELGILMSIILAIIYTAIGALLGLILGLLLRWRIKPRYKWMTAISLTILIALFVTLPDWPRPAAMPLRDAAAIEPVPLPEADNPSLPGTYEFSSFTYGSGADKHRDIFGEEVDWFTNPVDASAYITKWSNLKTLFWGFDERKLPLGGRVWMPEGDGPFPLALIVHGNHLMEQFSDGGYAYLGELLASRGMIAISVDENFLNYSVWSGIPNNDMKVRAWMLLQHLKQIKQFNDRSGNPFSNKVDTDNISLIGHSRGGQAVAMAADAGRWFKEDKSLSGIEDVRIRSVVAIAPTDKQVDDKSARLKDVNYLTLQGARDGDVNSFYGDRQYGRSTFSDGSGAFKASLYIADANHSQFNTAWGMMDERLPGGMFLNRQGMLDGDEQREIAKLYISAFLEATLHDEHEYREMFSDYRTALEWLPQSTYVSRYESSDFKEITRFDGSSRKTTISGGGKASAEGMTEWEVANAEDRDGKSKGTKGISLKWEEPGAGYELELPQQVTERLSSELQTSSLVFSMANLERDLLEGGVDETDEALEEEAEAEVGALTELPPLPELEIVLTSNDGRSYELPLSEVMPVSPPTYAAFTTLPWLEERMKDEKYKESNEPVFQTFIVPFEAFELPDDSLDQLKITKIAFAFVNGPGKVMIDDIGFMP